MGALFATVLAISFLHIETQSVPSWGVRAVTEDGQPIPGALVREIWQNYSIESESSEQELTTDEKGAVVFPERRSNGSILRRVLFPIHNILRQGVHASFGTDAYVLVSADSMEGYALYKPGTKPAETVVVHAIHSRDAQVYPDLRTIAGVSPKGRIQDKEYNPSIKAVDELIGMGVEAVPILIQNLDDDKKIDHHVLDFWSYVTVGDLSLVILTDFFTTPSLTERTIQGASWSDILEVPADTDTTAEAQLRAFVSSKGRKAIRAKWEGIWQSYKDRLYWDETGRCFRVRQPPRARVP